ncbi:MAG: glucan 1,4-alpha-glucosidase, partial [Candidatus Acidiferrum sp.]
MRLDKEQNAPGKPGVPARWTSSAKTGVGTPVATQCRLWFTISHGIIDETYYPDVDLADTRDFQLIVTDGSSFFSEEKRDTLHEIAPLAQGVPGFHLTNTCKEGRYRISKTVAVDPLRETLLQRVKFAALRGSLADYRIYALLSPHVDDRGDKNDSWPDDYKGIPMLFAQRGGITLALACNAEFLHRSCGYVGTSDGWSDLRQHKRMTWFYS